MRYVLIVDGPCRGQVMPQKGYRFLATGPLSALQEIEPTTYHVHKFLIAGRLINLASIELISENVSLPDVFELIVSDKAKEAAD
jgi:hypothetical protein